MSMAAQNATDEQLQVKPFRLLDLPQEIQDKIYEAYHQGVKLTLPLQKGSLPSLNIEVVSRKVGHDAKKVRDAIWPRKIEVSAEGWLQLTTAERFVVGWLGTHIDSIDLRSAGHDELFSVIIELPSFVMVLPTVRFLKTTHRSATHFFPSARNPASLVQELFSEAATYEEHIGSNMYASGLQRTAANFSKNFGDDWSVTTRRARRWAAVSMFGALRVFLLEVCYASLTIGFQSLLTYLQVTDTDVHPTEGHITNQWLHSEGDDVNEYLRSIGKLLPDNLLHEFHDYGGWSIN